MKRKTLIILSTLILMVTNLYAHKDRIERPIQFKFVFSNQDTMIINDTDKSSIDSISQMITKGEKELVNALLSFETGEQIAFKYVDSKLNDISIVDSKQELTVPKETINKLQEVHFTPS